MRGLQCTVVRALFTQHSQWLTVYLPRYATTGSTTTEVNQKGPTLATDGILVIQEEGFLSFTNCLQ